MPANRGVEIGTGLFVLLGFAALAFLTTQLPGSRLSSVGSGDTFSVTARFDNVGDLRVGAYDRVENRWWPAEART